MNAPDSTEGICRLTTIDVVCDAFELAWQRRESPSIGEYFSRGACDARGDLLRELVLIEAEYRGHQGLPLDAATLIGKFPGFEQTIEEALEEARSAAGRPISWQAISPGFAAKCGDRYEAVRLLGRGACGSVYLAIDRERSRHVAIKFPHPHLLDSSEARGRFAREARCSEQLDHPGLVKVLDVGNMEDCAYLVTEYVDGPTLEGARRWHEGGIAVGIVVRWMRKIAEALEGAHRVGVIHRDLKPSNVLLSVEEADGTKARLDLSAAHPRITDFGLARRIGSESRLTGSAEVLGTLAYMSPEQARGEAMIADARSDIFSLGVIFHEMLCGRHPYSVAGEDTLAWLRGSKLPFALSRNVPGGIRWICGKCMERSPDRRFQSCGELLEALRKWEADGSGWTSWRHGLRYTLRRLWLRLVGREGIWIGSTMTVLVVVVLCGWNIRSSLRDHSRAGQRIMALLSADARSFSPLLTAVRGALPAPREDIHELLDDESLSSSRRLRLLMAILPDEQGWRERLIEDLGKSELTFLPVAVECLRSILPAAERPGFIEAVWRRALDRGGASGIGRLACVLSGLDAKNGKWREIVEPLIAELMAIPSADVESMVAMLRPVRGVLLPDCRSRFRQETDGEFRLRVAQIVIGLAENKVEDLVSLVAQADGRQHRLLVEALKGSARREEARTLLEHELEKRRAARGEGGDGAKEFKAISKLACALLELGHEEVCWPLLSDDSPPGLRFQIISDLSVLGVSPKGIVLRLTDIEGNDQIRTSLVLAVGGYSRAALDNEKVKLLEWSRLNFVRQGSAATHSGIEWLLRRMGEGAWVRRTVAELSAKSAAGDREWRVITNGHTMIAIKGPMDFEMGCGTPVPADAGDETSHRRHIPRSIEMATTPVTREQFSRFKSTPSADPKSGDDLDCPAVAVSFEDALRYCNWLSAECGIPEDEWAYPEAFIANLADGSAVEKSGVEKLGYRLPTEAEWEYACRAGVDERFFFGASADLLSEFAWCEVNSANQLHGAGELKPNQLGLFDMQGNALQWCQDVYREYPRASVNGDEGQLEASQEARVARGSAFNHDPKSIRASQRYRALPQGGMTIGFRVARTLSESSE